jgi:hypothetical protein
MAKKELWNSCYGWANGDEYDPSLDDESLRQVPVVEARKNVLYEYMAESAI